MNKELTLWQFIAERLNAGQSVMLMVVTESSGSSPGRQGFKMAVGEDRLLSGSIGGGIMEVKLVELAKKMLIENETSPTVKKQIHNKEVLRDQSGMICSGEQTVIYFKINNSNLKAVNQIINTISNYKSGQLKISFDGLTSSIIIESNEKSQRTGFEKTEDRFSYVESIGYKQAVYIVGGGHCSLALSELLSRFDFYIHVIDDRPGLNTMDQNIFVHEKHLVEDYNEVDTLIPEGPDTYVVIMTLGYRSDLVALQRLKERSFGYIGLLGSEVKVKALITELEKSGISNQWIAGLHAPIGVRINSHTPEEIAVSIAAEIIKVKSENAGNQNGNG
jgi:xanthine dehydrogenase accessory factor